MPHRALDTQEAALLTIGPWAESGGALVITHDLFRLVVGKLIDGNYGGRGGGGRSGSGKQRPDVAENISRLLLDPGPDLLIVDEAHVIKNTDSKLYQALDRVATPRRVLLTGTPLQNNLLEYFHMVSFVKKGELGDQSKFCRLYKEKISKTGTTTTTTGRRSRRQGVRPSPSSIRSSSAEDRRASRRTSRPAECDHLPPPPLQRQLYDAGARDTGVQPKAARLRASAEAFARVRPPGLPPHPAGQRVNARSPRRRRTAAASNGAVAPPPPAAAAGGALAWLDGLPGGDVPTPPVGVVARQRHHGSRRRRGG